MPARAAAAAMYKHRVKLATTSGAEKTRRTDPQPFPNRLWDLLAIVALGLAGSAQAAGVEMRTYGTTSNGETVREFAPAGRRRNGRALPQLWRDHHCDRASGSNGARRQCPCSACPISPPTRRGTRATSSAGSSAAMPGGSPMPISRSTGARFGSSPTTAPTPFMAAPVRPSSPNSGRSSR